MQGGENEIVPFFDGNFTIKDVTIANVVCAVKSLTGERLARVSFENLVKMRNCLANCRIEGSSRNVQSEGMVFVLVGIGVAKLNNEIKARQKIEEMQKIETKENAPSESSNKIPKKIPKKIPLAIELRVNLHLLNKSKTNKNEVANFEKHVERVRAGQFGKKNAKKISSFNIGFGQ